MFKWLSKKQKPSAIIGDTFIKELQALGIVPPFCKRVEVHAGFDEVTTVYFECVGDDRLTNAGLVNALGELIYEKRKKEGLDADAKLRQERQEMT